MLPAGSSDAPATFRAGDIVHQRRSGDVDRIASRFIYARATLWIAISPVYQVALASAIRSMLYSLLRIVRSEIELVVSASHTRIAVSSIYHATLASTTRGVLHSTRGLQRVQSRIKLVVDCVAPRDARRAETRTTLSPGQRYGELYIDRVMDRS